MKTKFGQILLSILPVACVIAARGADDIPQRLDFNRYNTMLQKSPFAVASQPAAPVATPNFAKDLYVANAAHADQFDLVTIISASDKNWREYLTTERPNEHGYSISNIQWSDKPGETKVTISKDGQFATIGFNQALMNQPASSVPAQAGAQTVAPMAIPTPVQQPNIPKPPQYPAVATPQPRTRPVIQRNPQTAAGPHAPIPGAKITPLPAPNSASEPPDE